MPGDMAPGSLTVWLDIVVTYAELAIDTLDLPGVTLGEAYTCTLTAIGGDYDFAWYTSGLPGGLTLKIRIVVQSI